MSNTFIAADLHLSHQGIVKFLCEDGITKERPWDNIHDMNEAIIHNWNSIITPRDRVLVLGDAVINRSALPQIGRLNGQKELVMGNHDVFRTEEYMEYFHKVHGSLKIDDIIFTHIPVHPSELGSRWKVNCHGHLHSKVVMREWNHYDDVWYEPDERYICCSLEHINYTPISLEDLKIRIKEQQEK